jgi:ubiquinone/menaquinone biosynthesis C-methylase UbiE
MISQGKQAKVMDIAAGGGRYLIELAKKYENKILFF